MLIGSSQSPKRQVHLPSAPGPQVLKNVDPDAPELDRKAQDVLRSRNARSRKVATDLEDPGHHGADPEAVVVPDELAQGLLVMDRRQLPSVRPRAYESEMATVALGYRRRRLFALGSGTVDRVDERDRKMGGEELVGGLDGRQGNLTRDGVHHLTNLQCNTRHR